MEICDYCNEKKQCQKSIFYYGYESSKETFKTDYGTHSIKSTYTKYNLLGKREFDICNSCIRLERKQLFKKSLRRYYIFVAIFVFLLVAGMSESDPSAIVPMIVSYGMIFIVVYLIMRKFSKKYFLYRSLGNKENKNYINALDQIAINNNYKEVLFSEELSEHKNILFWVRQQYENMKHYFV